MTTDNATTSTVERQRAGHRVVAVNITREETSSPAVFPPETTGYFVLGRDIRA